MLGLGTVEKVPNDAAGAVDPGGDPDRGAGGVGAGLERAGDDEVVVARGRRRVGGELALRRALGDRGHGHLAADPLEVDRQDRQLLDDQHLVVRADLLLEPVDRLGAGVDEV